MVHHAAKALALISLIAIVGGCGGGDASPQRAAGVGPNVGEPINLADCSDWNRANTEQRLGTIKELRNFAGGPVLGNSATSPSGTGSVLDDEKAYDLFNGYCKNDFARGFKLYKLYERAAAFAGHPQ